MVIEERRLVHYADRIVELFPEQHDLRRMGAVSYMGVPLTDLDGTMLGHLAVMDQRVMPLRAESFTIFEIFAGRAAAELRRLRAERAVRARRRSWRASSTARWTRSSSSTPSCGSWA